MKGTTSSQSQGLSNWVLWLIASGALFASGCANMTTTATGLDSTGAATSITGKVYGGNQPVALATVKLMFVKEGFGPDPVGGATTVTSNDGTGSFSFSRNPVNGLPGSGNIYSCPTNNSLVYLVASGGNTLNTGSASVNNSASVFLATFGLCSNISSSTFVNMTEVTTVATMAALQQYFNPVTETFSTDGTGRAKSAITNAFALIPNLVDASSGTAVSSKVISAGSITAGVGYAGTSVTVTPESSKVNLIANIISACVNNASASASACSTLFSNATPPNPTVTSKPTASAFPTASDVLQATYYMLTNPTSGSTTNMTNLFNLSPAVGAPFQPVPPTVPTDWTIAISYSSSSTCGTSSGHLIQSPKDLAIDSYGAVWLANSEPGTGNLTQLDPTGIPVTCIAVGSGANNSLSIDTASGLNNIWVTDSGSSNVFRYKPGTSNILAFPTSSAAMAISADGQGNIFYTSPADTTLYELPQSMNSVAAVAPVAVATGIGAVPAHVMVDGTAAVWTTSGSNFVTRTTSATPNNGTGFTSSPITSLSPTYGLSITAVQTPGNTNYVFTGQQGTSNSLSLYNGSGTSYSSVSGWPVTGLSSPAAVVSDGAQNVYSINNASGANSLVAIGLNKQAISPATGFVKSAAYLGGGRSLVIDQSGNLWVGLDGANSITEIVGTAVPVIQPYSTGLAYGTFQTAP